ncbi:MAG: beta-ketoacyl-ACP synthase II [Alphaproteobacteria bacterium]|nr:beta-ketoacyl-ACP synthase II [Alphaproteobacteria bacterium]
MERRVVITGLGAITPIGNTVDEMWQGIEEKRCGIDKITHFNVEGYKTSLAAEVKNYNPLDYFEAKNAKRLDKSSQFAIIAAKEAFADSGITEDNTDFERIGVFVSSGIAGLKTIQEQCETNYVKGHNRVSPMFIPMTIANMPAGNIAIELGAKGESISIVSACASSTHSIGEAYKTIKYGSEDVILAGGTEASICGIGIAGFENMKALSYATDPNRASIPFDKERSGFVMGEGAGVLVLEELEHAISRGAKIYAEVIGYGATSDAYHITSPAPMGEGGARAMKRAIEDSKIKPEEIDYINAHGTSTHLNDSLETQAIKTALGEIQSKNIMVSSTKSNMGHLLGAAGGVEAIICTKAIQNGVVPPTINYKEKDEECDLDIVPNEPRKANLNIVMSNSLGFGGHNASIILKKYEK